MQVSVAIWLLHKDVWL